VTGPFVRVKETKLYGPTWVNAARIVKIQASSDGTTIFLEGAGTMQIEEPVEAFVGRLDAALAEQVLPQSPARSLNGARRGRTKSAEAQDA
jgi:hypothetical protein